MAHISVLDFGGMSAGGKTSSTGQLKLSQSSEGLT
jgi:hypothetical protein